MGHKTTNTTEEAINNPLLGLMAGLNIEGQEKRGQSELVNSCQLPSRHGGHGKDGSAFEQYEKMGIKVIGLTKGDTMFAEVELPEGWKKRGTGHSMWNELVDDKGRVRATFFYKAAFYDRDAFIHFERRFNISIISYLPSDQKGHYEKQMVEVPNPNYVSKKKLSKTTEIRMGRDGDSYIIEQDGYVRSFAFGHQPKYIKKEEDVWIAKFKDSYQEYNNTPHYFEITDCGKVIFTTQDDPIFFRRKYTKKNHAKWWSDYEHIKERMRIQATIRLKETNPDYENINAYWD